VESRFLFAVLLCVPCLWGCGARRSVSVPVPDQIGADDQDDAEPTPTQKDIDQAIREALEQLYAARKEAQQ
jgi:hypothetical protein